MIILCVMDTCLLQFIVGCHECTGYFPLGCKTHKMVHYTANRDWILNLIGKSNPLCKHLATFPSCDGNEIQDHGSSFQQKAPCTPQADSAVVQCSWKHGGQFHLSFFSPRVNKQDNIWMIWNMEKVLV